MLAGCSGVTAPVSSVMFFLRCRPVLAPLHVRANKPQQRVQREEAQHAPQQQVHEESREIQRRIQLSIMWIRMRLILHKAVVRIRVAPDRKSTRLNSQSRQYLV